MMTEKSSLDCVKRSTDSILSTVFQRMPLPVSSKQVIKHFVIRWAQLMDQDFIEDHHGWPKGRRSRSARQTEHCNFFIYSFFNCRKRYRLVSAVINRFNYLKAFADICTLFSAIEMI